MNLGRPWVFCAVNSSEPIPDIGYETFSFMMSLLAKSFGDRLQDRGGGWVHPKDANSMAVLAWL